MSAAPTYMLIVTGSLVDPRLDIAFYDDEEKSVRHEAKKIVGKLFPAGYIDFTLYKIEIGGTDFFVTSYKVEQRVPMWC